MWMMIALAVLFILLTGLAYWNYAYTRRLNQELARRNETLARLSSQLEETTRAKLDFFTNVSHDLRTPLTLVAGPLEHVLSGPLEEGQRQTLLLARRNVDILRQLVNSVFDKFDDILAEVNPVKRIPHGKHRLEDFRNIRNQCRDC